MVMHALVEVVLLNLKDGGYCKTVLINKSPFLILTKIA